MKMLKNPIVLGIIGIVLLIIIFAGAYVLFIAKSSSNQSSDQTPATTTQQIPVIKPEDIGLTLTPRSDNKAIIVDMTKVSNLKSVDYDISYDASVTDPDTGETSTVPRGVDGTIDVKPTDTEIKREIELGSCSRNVCTYDKVVSGIKVDLKITYSDGHLGAVEQTVNLNQ